MKKRDLVLSTIVPPLIFAMMIFNSCASNNQVDQDEASSTDSQTTNAPTEAPAQASDDSKEAAALTAGTDTDNALATPPDMAGDSEKPGAAPTEGTAAKADAEVPSTNDQTPAEPLPTDAASPPAVAEAPSADKSADVPSDPTAVPGTDGDAAAIGLPSDGELNQAQKGQEKSETAVPPTGTSTPESVANTDSQAVANLMKAEKSERPPRSRHFGYGPVPKIPAHAIQMDGANLNRFYFARRGDTPKKTAQLLYGDSGRLKALKTWNPGAWRPGKLVYYESASQPQDDQMRSFYQERGVQADEYTVKASDRIGRIAAKKLGSPSSWKEIAVVNGLESATALSPGQKIAIYPKDLSSYGPTSGAPAESVPAPQAANAPIPTQNPPTPGATPNAAQTNAAAVPPTTRPASPVTPIANEPPFKQKRKSGAGLDSAKLFQQNLPFIVLAGGVAALLVLLYAVNKRRRSSGGDDSSDEEGFSPRVRRR